MGKSKVEHDIQEEAMHLVEDFKKQTDKDETMPMSLGVAVFNVIWKMVAGKLWAYVPSVIISAVRISTSSSLPHILFINLFNPL